MIAVISDLHIHNYRVFGGVKVSGINERCHLTLLSIAKAIQTANEAKCTALVITGDIYEVADPTPQVEAALIEQLACFNGDVHVLVGNHDQFSTAEGDNALGPLHLHRTQGGVIHVHDAPYSPVWDISSPMLRTAILPFNPLPVSEWLPEALDDIHADIVFAHFGIIDDETPPWLQDAPDAFSAFKLFQLMKKHKVQRFIVGNWHEHDTWRSEGREIVQVGALTPTGFSNVGSAYGHVVIIDPKKAKSRSVQVPGPRFMRLEYWDADTVADLISSHNVDQGECGLFLRVECAPEDYAEAKAHLKRWRDDESIKDFEVKPSKERAQKAARAAAQATSQVDALQGAASAYVGKMPLGEGVSRKNVLAHVQKYLKR